MDVVGFCGFIITPAMDLKLYTYIDDLVWRGKWLGQRQGSGLWLDVQPHTQALQAFCF